MQSATNQTYYTALEIDMVCKSITRDQDSSATERYNSIKEAQEAQPKLEKADTPTLPPRSVSVCGGGG